MCYVTSFDLLLCYIVRSLAEYRMTCNVICDQSRHNHTIVDEASRMSYETICDIVYTRKLNTVWRINVVNDQPYDSCIIFFPAHIKVFQFLSSWPDYKHFIVILFHSHNTQTTHSIHSRINRRKFAAGMINRYEVGLIEEATSETDLAINTINICEII